MVRSLPSYGVVLVFLASFVPSAAAAPGRAAVSCAVEGSARPLRAAELCRALEGEIGRPTTAVDDARATKRGDAIQLIHDDVQWYVIWLTDGRIRAWTRVSHIEAASDQVRFLGRATRALAATAKKRERTCIQLDPNAGRKMRSDDLKYPWAALAPCQRRFVEVADPWWIEEAAKPRG